MNFPKGGEISPRKRGVVSAFHRLGALGGFGMLSVGQGEVTEPGRQFPIHGMILAGAFDTACLREGVDSGMICRPLANGPSHAAESCRRQICRCCRSGGYGGRPVEHMD